MKTYQVSYCVGGESDTEFLKGTDAVREFVKKPEIDSYMIWANVSDEFKEVQ